MIGYPRRRWPGFGSHLGALSVLTFGLSLVLLLVACGGEDAAAPAGPADAPVEGQAIAFVNVNVLPMDSERVLEDQVVVVQGDRITAVGPGDEVEIPAGARQIDGDGGFLMPGLADMHTHLAGEIGRDSDPGSLVLYLAEGTTTVRSMNGVPENREWRSQVEEGALVGPTILTAGETMSGGSFVEGLDAEDLGRLHVAVPTSPQEAAVEVERQAAAGNDFAKVYDGLTEEVYLAAIAAANDAGFYVAGHALDEASLETVLTSGIDELAHLDELNFYFWSGSPGEPDFALDYDAISETAALIKENDVAIVSNMVADELMAELIFDTEGVLSRPEYEVVPPQMLEAWRTQGRQLRQFAKQGPYRRDVEFPFFKALVGGLQDAGVMITIGTDTSRSVEGTVPGLIHRELELLVESGFSTYEALVAGTRTAGTVVERMGRDGSFGTVVPGARADMILLRANPLEDVSRTRDRIGVMAHGVWYTQAELDQSVADLVATYPPAEPVEAPSAAVELEPFRSDELGIGGVKPSGWTELEPGVFTRSDPNADPTFLIQQAAPLGQADALVTRVLGEFGATELGEPAESFDSAGVTWEVFMPQGELAMVAARAATAERAYLVLLVTAPDEFEQLVEALFKPVVGAFAPTAG